MENFKSKKESKDSFLYYLLTIFWSIFLIYRIIFLFLKIYNNSNASTHTTFNFFPIKNQYRIHLAIFVFRFQWFNSDFYIKQMTLKSFSPNSKINTIQYSNSKIALNSGYRGIYTQNCLGEQPVQIAIPCRIDEMFSYFYNFDYSPWILIGTNELYYSEENILKLLDFLESEYNPMAENIVVGNFFNDSVIFESGIIFSRSFVKLVIDTNFSFYDHILYDNKIFQKSLLNFLHDHKEKVHVHQNHFSFFSFPSEETWNSQVFKTKKIKNLKKSTLSCPNTKQLATKMNVSLSQLKFVKIYAKDTISLYMNQIFKNETAVLAKYLQKLPTQIKFIQLIRPKFQSFLCFDENNRDVLEFKKENILKNNILL